MHEPSIPVECFDLNTIQIVQTQAEYFEFPERCNFIIYTNVKLFAVAVMCLSVRKAEGYFAFQCHEKLSTALERHDSKLAHLIFSDFLKISLFLQNKS